MRCEIEGCDNEATEMPFCDDCIDRMCILDGCERMATSADVPYCRVHMDMLRRMEQTCE